MKKEVSLDEELTNILYDIKYKSVSINNTKGLSDTEKVINISELYNEIYEKFGGIIYRKHTPVSIRLINAKEMIKNNISEDEIIKKHGKRVYKKAKESKIARFLKRAASGVLSSIVIWNMGMSFAYAEAINSDDYKKAEAQIILQAEAADDNWTDIQTIAYVLNCLNGLGKEEAKKELNIAKFTTIANEKTGVCRNYSDYFAQLINKINPEYKARIINTYSYPEGLEDEGSFEDRLYGNHSIVVMQIPEHNLNLVIDPYNSSLKYNDIRIGFLQDGEIHMIQNGVSDVENKRTYFEGLIGRGNNATFFDNFSLQKTTRSIDETYALVESEFNSDKICKIMREMQWDAMIEYDEKMW